MKILKNIKIRESSKISKQKKKKRSMFFQANQYFSNSSYLYIVLSLSLYKNNIIRNKTNLLLNEKNNELVIAKKSGKKLKLGQNFSQSLAMNFVHHYH
jgi:hypothetical protein